MTTYRHDLDAAHLRIAFLEDQLAESKKADETVEVEVESEPPTLRNPDLETVIKSESASSPSPTTPTPDHSLQAWHLWPIPALAVLIAVYVVAHGTNAPPLSEMLTGMSELGTGSLATISLVSAMLGVFIMLLKLTLRCISGRPTVVERLLVVIAVVTALPCILITGVTLLNIVGGLIAIAMLLAGVLGALAWIYKWISTGSAD